MVSYVPVYQEFYLKFPLLLTEWMPLPHMCILKRSYKAKKQLTIWYIFYFQSFHWFQHMFINSKTMNKSRVREGLAVSEWLLLNVASAILQLFAAMKVLGIRYSKDVVKLWLFIFYYGKHSRLTSSPSFHVLTLRSLSFQFPPLIVRNMNPLLKNSCA